MSSEGRRGHGVSSVPRPFDLSRGALRRCTNNGKALHTRAQPAPAVIAAVNAAVLAAQYSAMNQ